MKLTNEFEVSTPVDATWKTLLDLQRVASCLPGATITPGDAEGSFRGEMKVKLGAVTTQYTGVAEIREADDDQHLAVFDVRGRELRGQGTAAATITSHVTANGGAGAKVTVETDLHISGRQAQFGRGIMEDVAKAMLGEFARRLEREIAGGGASSGAGAAPDAAAAAPSNGTARPAPGPPPRVVADDDDDVLDLGAAAWRPVLQRALPLGLGALVVVLLAVLVTGRVRGRSRRGITLKVDL